MGNTERVVNLETGIRVEPNAPDPYILSGAASTTLLFRSSLENESKIGILRFQLCTQTIFGRPNDEIVHRHRLWEKGLKNIRDFGEVLESEWLADIVHRNSAHPRHKPSLFDKKRHFIVLFRDSTFECIANSFAVAESADGIQKALDDERPRARW